MPGVETLKVEWFWASRRSDMDVYSRKMHVAACALIVCGGALLYLAGCQSGDRIVATEAPPECPNCKAVTRIQPLTGLTYTTCYCPTCKKVTNLDPEFLERAEDIFGGNLGASVYVCDTCKAIVEKCSICRAKEAK
jgi:hypothetical protein